MKRSTIVLFLVLIGLLVAPFAALADAPTAEPPPGAELPPATEPPAPPPATDAECQPPTVDWEGECVVMIDGDLSVSEVVAMITAANENDPYFGTQPLDLSIILRYLRIHTPNIPGYGPLTAVQVGATCSALVKAERLNDEMYYKCYAILSHALANLDELCPTLSKMITFLLGRAGTATTRKLLESAQTAHNAFCFGKTVGIGGAKVLAMPAPIAEPPPGAEPLPEPTPEPIAEPAEYPEYCPVVAFTHEDGECVFLLAADLSTSEVVALTRAAFAANPDPFLGAGDLDTIMQYLATTTDRVFGFAVETRVLVGKTCRDLADALGGGYIARAGHYSDCVEALRRVYGNFKQLGCPALDALIVRLTALQSAGTIAAAQKKTLEGALASYAALCANGR